MGVDIDKLNIEISGNSDKAQKSIDQLCASLSKLKSNLAKNTEFQKFNEQLAKLRETVKKYSDLSSYTEKINKYTESIHKLTNLKIPSVSKMSARIRELVDMSKEMSSFTGVDELTEKVNQICSAMKPMEGMGKNTLAPFISSLKKIPELTKSMDMKTLQDFKNMIKEITSAVQPLITQVSKSEKGLVSLNRIIQSTVSGNGNLAASNAAAVKSYTSVSSILTSTKAKLLAYSYAVIRVTRVLKDWLDLSNDYIENLNLFEVAMGKGAKAALNYAESINKALGIDVSDWIRNQGVFKQVTSGFGVLNDTSDIMSKNLTQLGYDISSFFNIDVDEAMQKLQSGISGEIEPLRRLGYAIDAATLQQVAYANGITTSINKMTQAQKSQLRYIAILQQSQNVMGDMARTVTTPANAMRILDQQMTQLKRSIGNIISILVQKLLPYIQAFVRLLGDAADYLAKLWGFELPTIDYSNVGNGLSNISDEADNATESVKQTAKQMQMLAGFDELNILGDKKSNSDDSSVSTKPDLGIQMPEYDFLSGLDNQGNSVYKNMREKALELIEKFKDLAGWIKENKRLVGILAGALLTLYTANKAKKFFEMLGGLSIFKTAKTWLSNFMKGFKADKGVNFFKKLQNGVKEFRKQLSPATRLLGTIAGSALAGVGSYNLFKDLAKDTASWKSVLADSAMIVGGLGMSWIFGGLPGLGVGLLVTAFSGLYGHAKGLHEKFLAINKAAIESKLFNNGGIKIDELTDAFGEQYKKLDELNSKMKNYDQKIGENKQAVNDYRSAVETYREKINGTGTLAETELGPMTEALDGLAESLKKSTDLDCSKFFDTVKQSISEAAKNLPIDIQKISDAIIQFQTKHSDNITQAQNTVNSYTKKIASGEAVTPEETAQYEKELDYLTNMGNDITQAKTNFQNALKDASKIDFENENATKEALDDLKKYAKEAQNDAKDIYQSSLNVYDNLMQSLNYDYKTGKLDKSTYKKFKKQYDDMKLGIETAYKENKEEIKKSLKDTTQKIYDSANKITFDELERNTPNLKNMSKEWVQGQLKELRDDMGYLYSGIDDIVGSNNIKLSDKLEKDFLDSFKNSSLPSAVENFVVDQFHDYNELMSSQTDKIIDSHNDKMSTVVSPKLKTTAKDTFKSISSGITENIPELNATLNGVRGNITSNMSKDFGVYNIGKNNVSGEFSQGLKDGIPLLNESFNQLDIEFDERLRDMTNKIAQKAPAIKDQINKLFSFSQQSSNPLLQIGGTAAIIGLGAINGYASGGFPTTGQLFVARENGIPEMVGKIGNQTAVANNGQIEQGIANAVYKAMSSAMGSPVNSEHPINVTVPVYIDGQKIDEQQYSYRQRQLVRSNGRREY